MRKPSCGRKNATSLRHPSTNLLLILAATCDAGRHPWGVARSRLMLREPAVRQPLWSASVASFGLTVRGGSRDETSVEPDNEESETADEAHQQLQPQVEPDSADVTESSEVDEKEATNEVVSEADEDSQASISESDDVEPNEDEEDIAASEATTHVSPEAMHPAVVETTTTTVLEADLVDLANDATTGTSKGDETESESPEEESQEQTPTQPLTKEQIEEYVEEASQLRTLGKELHDNEQYSEAASKFSSAADLLFPILADDDSVADDFATCRLHQALCFLKAKEYDEAIQACTDVLDLPPTTGSVEPALRARAFHRRAKAQVELGDEDSALQDARSAAFLGDRKAVALYGKLMRGSGSGSSSSLMDSGDSASDLEASNALFESLLGKSSGSVPSMSGSPSSSSSPPGMGDMGNMLPSSLFDMMGAASAGAKGDKNSGPGSLAKSVLSSLSKRLEDESTQDQICNYLQNTSGPQLKQMASMAGFDIQEGQANRLASFAQGVTPKTIRRTLRTTKTAYYAIQLIRKTSKVISKYRTFIIFLIIAAWIRSALNRPFPVNKRLARLAAKEAAKAAANAATEAPLVTIVKDAAEIAVDAM